MIGLALAAVLVFVSTNVDDLFVLLLFFGQPRRASEVVLGQYLGFGAIVLASLVASAGALLVRQEWVGSWTSLRSRSE
jgi:cadmium resistance protein CadD (predicted permease)